MVKSNKYLSAVAIITLFVLAILSFIGGLQSRALWVVVPSAFALSFLAFPKKNLNNVYFKYMLFLYLWIAFTYIFAFNQEVAARQLRTVVGCFAFISTFLLLSKEEKNIPWLYLVYLVYYVGMLNYANTNIITEDYDYTEDRLDIRNGLGANTFAYFTFFSTFIIYILDECLIDKPRLRKIFRILFLLTPLLSFIIAILTASRQVFIIQIPIIIGLLYIRYLRGASSNRRVIFFIVAVLVLIVSLSSLVDIYSGSLLQSRNEKDIADDSRMRLIRKAIMVGLEHPIVGVGPGNYAKYLGQSAFSHCTYTELFANSGLLAMILFIVLLWTFVARQWKRYKRTKDGYFLAFWLFGVFYVIDNFFYVYYAAPWLMAIFFLVAMHSEQYYKKYYSRNIKLQI